MTEEEAIRLFSLAATIIQAHVRGYLVRKKFDFCQYRRRKYAAASIQAVWYKNSLISFWSIILNRMSFLFLIASFSFPFFPSPLPSTTFSFLPLTLKFSLPWGYPCLSFPLPSHLIPSRSVAFLLLVFLSFHIRPLPFPFALFLPITSFSFLICARQSKFLLTANCNLCLVGRDTVLAQGTLKLSTLGMNSELEGSFPS